MSPRGKLFVWILFGATVLVSFLAFNSTNIQSQWNPQKLYTHLRNIVASSVRNDTSSVPSLKTHPNASVTMTQGKRESEHKTQANSSARMTHGNNASKPKIHTNSSATMTQGKSASEPKTHTNSSATMTHGNNALKPKFHTNSSATMTEGKSASEPKTHTNSSATMTQGKSASEPKTHTNSLATITQSNRTSEPTTHPSPSGTKTHSDSSQDVSQSRSTQCRMISGTTEAPLENPDASLTRPVTPGRKTPLHVSDPTKSVICHSFSRGRFGNHLFEYASILGIADTTNKTFFFHSDGGLGKVLKHPPVQRGDPVAMKKRCLAAVRLGEGWASRFDRKFVQLQPGKDYAINGYLQSWLYFDGIENDLRLALTFNDKIVRAAERVVGAIRKRFPGSTLVGVHVRRGDLWNSQFNMAPPQFFNKAMTYFRRRFPRVTFVVLGDDRRWSVENIRGVKNDTVFPAPGSPAVDMEVLSRTDHLVKSTGTFGWWAAFKNPGRPTVVYLKDFVKPGTPLVGQYSQSADDHMLPRWIPMR